MTGAQQGFLLLTQRLGDPLAKPLTPAQFRELSRLARLMDRPSEDRPLRQDDLMACGCDRAFSKRIISLLDREEALNWYIGQAEKAGCVPVTCFSGDYPARLDRSLGADAPAVLWAKGDLSLLSKPGISLVGSRELRPENHRFAQQLGTMAAQLGLVLVSGNARGADRTAQESCLEAGGCVVSVVADRLEEHICRERVLYLSEDGFDASFSSHRALRRNRIIHSLNEKTVVAQCTYEKGGTWDGTVKNLRQGWSQVYCFWDGSAAAKALCDLGAYPVVEVLPEMLLPESSKQLQMKI